MFITYKLLKSKGACHSQREMFKKHFPDGVQVTLELCQKYYKTFDFDWAAKNLLSYSAYKEYEKICDSAHKEYRKINNSAYKEYRKICDSAYKEYEKIRDSAYKEYEKIRAKAFGELSMKEV